MTLWAWVRLSFRRLAGLYYKPGGVYRVLFGDLRGAFLRYGDRMPFHSVLGLVDRKTFRLIARSLKAAGVLRPGMVVADVGANVGIYSLWFSRLLAPYGGARIYAFEPSPETAGELSFHVHKNAATVDVIPVGISDTVGHAEFYVDTNQATSSFYREHAQECKDVIQVAVTTLDAFFSGDRECPDFIKIDIEGAATRALNHIDGCLEKKRALLFIESHDQEEDRAIGDLARRHRYRAYRVDDGKWVRDYLGNSSQEHGVWGNLLLFPEEICPKVELVLPR